MPLAGGGPRSVTLPSRSLAQIAAHTGCAGFSAPHGLYDEIDTVDARSNVDIEKRLRRAEIKAAHAQTWVAVAQALGVQGDRYEGR